MRFRHSSWNLPSFSDNQSGDTQQTDHTRSTGDPGTGNTTSTKIYSGTCIQHWGANVVYNYFYDNKMFPEKMRADNNISAKSINAIKNLLNTLIRGWTQGGSTQIYTNIQSFSSKNEKINATNISTEAYPENIIKTDIWNDVVSRLEIFDTIKNASRAPSDGVDRPATTIPITRANYNRIIDSLTVISKACKCNSDCACNMVCVCNADCGCNY